MCTLSWLLDREGYRLFFNRDERRTRRPALPPRQDGREGVRFLAPRDGDHGGTWMHANERGITLALLNLYQAERPLPEGEFTSRGLLVLELADLGRLAGLEPRLARAGLARYQPFSLAAFEPWSPPLLARWDGEELSFGELGVEQCPFISSAFDPEGVRAARHATLEGLAREAGGLDEETLMRFHAGHLPARGPLSPCMHREDACTVSFSRVEVDARRIRFTYVPHSPCRGMEAEPILLSRREDPGKGAPGGGG